MAKKVIALAILGLGLAGGIFVLQNPIFIPNPEANNSALGNNLVLNQPFVEKLDEKSFSESLTDQFTKILADRIAKENPFGVQTENGQKAIAAPDPEQLATE